MQWLCVADGKRLRKILEDEVKPLELERWFNQLADRIARKPRHFNIAEQLGWTFSPSQRQVLALLFWEVFHMYWQRNRRPRAQAIVSSETK